MIKTRKFIYIMLIGFIWIILTGCSKGLSEGDIVVLPQQNPNSIQGFTNSNHSMIMNSYNNYSSNTFYSQTAKTLDFIPQDIECKDFDVLNRYLYIAGYGTDGVKQDGIGIYDVDGMQYIKTIGDKYGVYEALTIKGESLWAYESQKNQIHEFEANGELKTKYDLNITLMPIRMAFLENGWLVILSRLNQKEMMITFDSQLTKVFESDVSDFTRQYKLLDKGFLGECEIVDFDVFDSDKIIVRFNEDKIGLYNIKERVLEKYRSIDKGNDIFCFQDNIMYFTTSSSIAVFKNRQTNNYSNGNPGLLQRMLINSKFLWNDIEDVNEWKLTSLELSSNGLNSIHQKIKCRGDFVYIMDFLINEKQGGKTQGTLFYRMRK